MKNYYVSGRMSEKKRNGVEKRSNWIEQEDQQS